jgi:hypothetical protein
MKQNIGHIDRGLRLVIGLACLAGAYTRENHDAGFGVLLIVGVPILISAVSAYSILYSVFSISTRNPQGR